MCIPFRVTTTLHSLYTLLATIWLMYIVLCSSFAYNALNITQFSLERSLTHFYIYPITQQAHRQALISPSTKYSDAS